MSTKTKMVKLGRPILGNTKMTEMLQIPLTTEQLHRLKWTYTEAMLDCEDERDDLVTFAAWARKILLKVSSVIDANKEG